MALYDRLYGKIEFPTMVEQVLDCPGLLRLRRVGQANIPFARFPSFAYTSRYEHSLGVCYLAGITARKMDLSVKDETELMLACLYHDIGTPPFAHATEEVLQDMYGFNHETQLQNLILGRTSDIAKDKTPVYLRRGMHLQRICQSAKARANRIDLYRIADIITGNDKMLSPLVKSTGMDLDNIDNVLRAVSAMGIMKVDSSLPISLASSFSMEQGEIVYEVTGIPDFLVWQGARRKLYSAIFEDIEDFSYQAMIKMAIRYWLSEEGEPTTCWNLTDEQMFLKLLNNKKSQYLTERFLLLKPYQCQCMIYISFPISTHYKKASNWIKTINADIIRMNEELSDHKMEGQPEILFNYYADKRDRNLGINVSLNGYYKPSEEDRGGYYIAFFVKGKSSSRYDKNCSKNQEINAYIDTIVNQLTLGFDTEELIREGKQKCNFKNGMV